MGQWFTCGNAIAPTSAGGIRRAGQRWPDMADADLAARMQQAAEVIADRARELSSWSERIPASIHTLTADGSTVLIVAGGPPAPHAITFEAPNAPYWKHPVFATGPRESWHWVKQDPRRFLKPAVEEEADHAVRIVAQVVTDWAKFAGFRPA